MTDVFLSYARKDAPRARAIARALKGVGADVWTDGNLAPGEDWAEQIEERLTGATVIVLLITPSFLESSWAQLEMGYAVARSRNEANTVVPILLEDAVLPKFLSHFNVIDARKLTADELAEKMRSTTPTLA